MFWKLKKLIQENLFEEVKIFVMLSKQLAYSLTQRDTKCVFYAYWLQNEISKTPPGYFYRRNNAKIKQRHFFDAKNWTVFIFSKKPQGQFLVRYFTKIFSRKFIDMKYIWKFKLFKGRSEKSIYLRISSDQNH